MIIFTDYIYNIPKLIVMLVPPYNSRIYFKLRRLLKSWRCFLVSLLSPAALLPVGESFVEFLD